MAPYVRFDDLTPGAGRSFGFVGPAGVVAATKVAEVGEVLERVEQATAGGLWAAGFLCYEAAPAFDPAFRVRPPDGGVAGRCPPAWFGFFEEQRPVPPPEPDGWYTLDHWEPTVTAADYGAAIAAIKDRIAAGDTYQVNYSFRLRSRLRGDPRSFYADLAAAQRGAWAAYIDTDSLAVASASPELFFHLDEGVLTSRPMKGTARRGRWPAEDLALAARLAHSDKERAENLMIVDLIRNDVSRISAFGSVAVPALFDIERYDTVWQMTSTVTSRLRPDMRLSEVFGALFPCGSVTGAPKVSTMEIIAGLETSPRGPYCGAIGYVAPGGRRAAFSVAIRTAVVDPGTGEVEYGTGGGVTWDSTAEGEHAEAFVKAMVLTRQRPVFDLLETLRWEGAGYWELDRHLARLEASAAYFRFRFDREQVLTELEATAAVSGDDLARVRLTLAEDGTPHATATPLEPLPEPVRLVIDDLPVDPSDPMLYHKTTRRELYEDRLTRHPEADDVVLVNEAGEVTETTIANVLARLDGTWCTPPLESGCLPGVYRERLLEEGMVVERRLTPADLRAADDLAVVNSVRLRRRAVLVDEPA
ncbi:MAG: aminodeoxychorismate synthase component I [Actinobacteria bacterium]|nr:aminodeoxychorismate synthase component I [Actinomycetota bacterium]